MKSISSVRGFLMVVSIVSFVRESLKVVSGSSRKLSSR